MYEISLTSSRRLRGTLAFTGGYKVGLGNGEIKPCTAAQDGLYQQDPLGTRERVLDGACTAPKFIVCETRSVSENLRIKQRPCGDGLALS